MELIGECKGNNGNGCFMDSCGHDCGCFIRVLKEEPNKTHYLDELPNTDKDALLKMWNAAMPKLEPKQETTSEVFYRISKEIDYPEFDILSFKIGVEWQQQNSYSAEEFLEFSEWVSDNDWVYLPSKGYWVNEEQEESEQKFTTKELLKQFKNK
jgi:hypothetical protein